MFRRPLIIITTKIHYHTIYELPDNLKLKLFSDIHSFVEFWNLNNNYQLMINNGEFKTHHHFNIKMRIGEPIVNRMRRDHFARIELEKGYSPNSSIPIPDNNTEIVGTQSKIVGIQSKEYYTLDDSEK